MLWKYKICYQENNTEPTNTCSQWSIYIDSLDLDAATGNSDPFNDNRVFVDYTDCNSVPTTISFDTSGIYPNIFCADNTSPIVLYYYQDNLTSVSLYSIATEEGVCIPS